MTAYSGQCRRLQKLLFVFGVMLGLAACAEVNHLREAQSAFSAAAQAENAIQEQAIPNLAATSTIGLGYTNAIASLDSLSAEEISRLKDQGLWGNVLILKAMAYWRLKKYENALKTAREAASLQKNLGTRDRVMAEILPHLISSDENHEKLSAQNQLEDASATKFETAFKAAMATIEKARGTLAADHPMQRYLTTAHLAVFKNLSDACGKRRTFSPTCRKQSECGAYRSYADLRKLSAQIRMGSEQRAVFLRRWRNRAGFPATDGEMDQRCGLSP